MAILGTIEYHPSPLCGICTMIETDPTVKSRIEGSVAFNSRGWSQTIVMREYGIKPPSWYNHLKSHHYVVKRKDLSTVQLKQQEISQALQGELISKESSIKDNYEEVWDSIISKGKHLIDSGEMPVTSLMVMKASADKANHMAHKQDKKLDIAKMVFAYASGTKRAEEDATELTT